jgi:hypothetical protein
MVAISFNYQFWTDKFIMPHSFGQIFRPKMQTMIDERLNSTDIL